MGPKTVRAQQQWLRTADRITPNKGVEAARARRDMARYMHEFHADRDHESATFRTVPFQKSTSHSFENCPIRKVRALVFSKAHRNAQCFSTQWQHDNGGASWLKE
jgi:hypothetical protein